MCVNIGRVGNISFITIKVKDLINLHNGRVFPSFEKFRIEGAKALESVKDGKITTLQTKTGQYRILEESDFQHLLGLARDVERLRGGLRVLLRTARVLQKHPDAESIDLLVETVTMLGNLPELPTREHFEPLQPESSKIDPDDEVILDPSQIRRPLDASNTSEWE